MCLRVQLPDRASVGVAITASPTQLGCTTRIFVGSDIGEPSIPAYAAGAVDYASTQPTPSHTEQHCERLAACDGTTSTVHGTFARRAYAIPPHQTVPNVRPRSSRSRTSGVDFAHTSSVITHHVAGALISSCDSRIAEFSRIVPPW